MRNVVSVHGWLELITNKFLSFSTYKSMNMLLDVMYSRFKQRSIWSIQRCWRKLARKHFCSTSRKQCTHVWRLVSRWNLLRIWFLSEPLPEFHWLCVQMCYILIVGEKKSFSRREMKLIKYVLVPWKKWMIVIVAVIAKNSLVTKVAVHQLGFTFIAFANRRFDLAATDIMIKPRIFVEIVKTIMIKLCFPIQKLKFEN